MAAKKPITRICSVLCVILFMLAVTPLQAAHAVGVLFAKPGGSGDCSSWEKACSLQTALTGSANGDEVWVAAGTYKPTTDPTNRYATFQLKDGVAIYGGFTGAETARDQRNPATNVTILSGDIDNNDSQTPIITDLTSVTNNATNSFNVVTGATGATLDGFTITAGNANGNTTFSSFSGGGMYDESSSPALANLTFSGNVASYGGGMFNESGSSPMLTNITFYDNSAGVLGGGMENDYGSPTITNVTFSGNSATSGGGMENSNSSPMLTNVTFSHNSASVGGGMYNYHSFPTLLTNVTFSNNSADYGGGMYNDHYSNTTIRNTIFWGNTASSGAQIYIGDDYSITSVSYSVVQGGYAGGTNIITADPMLGIIGDYGGFTQTIPLLPGSSAVDTGNDVVCPTTDQRGVSRPQGTHCDIGAFEVEQFTISGTTHLSGVTLSYTNGGSQTALSDSNGDYSFLVPPGWSGTVTPYKVGYAFEPTNYIYVNVLTDQTDQNFIALIPEQIFLPLVER